LLSTAGVDPEHEAAGVDGGGPAGSPVGSGLFSLAFPASGGLTTSAAPPAEATASAADRLNQGRRDMVA
jgi:hypothetical protein